MSDTASAQTRASSGITPILVLGLIVILWAIFCMRAAYGVDSERLMWTVGGEWVEADCERKLNDCLLKVDDNYLFLNGQHISGVMRVPAQPLSLGKWEVVTRLHHEPVATFELVEDHMLLVSNADGTRVFNRLIW